MWCGAALAQGDAQALSREMLRQVKDDFKKFYLDPKLNVDALFARVEANIGSVTSPGQMFGLIAQALLNMKDTHTFLLPPVRAEVNYGWQMLLVGDTCYVISVNPNSDAAKQGLQPGDAILAMGRYKPTRDNLWQL